MAATVHTGYLVHRSQWDWNLSTMCKWRKAQKYIKLLSFSKQCTTLTLVGAFCVPNTPADLLVNQPVFRYWKCMLLPLSRTLQA